MPANPAHVESFDAEKCWSTASDFERQNGGTENE